MFPAGAWFIIAQDRAAFMRIVVIVKFPRKTELFFFVIWLVGQIFFVLASVYCQWTPTAVARSMLLLLASDVNSFCSSPGELLGRQSSREPAAPQVIKCPVFHSDVWEILKALMSEGICTPAEKTSHLISPQPRVDLFYYITSSLTTQNIKIGAITISRS